MAAINSLLFFCFFFVPFDDESRLGFLLFFVKYRREVFSRKRKIGRYLAVIGPILLDLLDQRLIFSRDILNKIVLSLRSGSFGKRKVFKLKRRNLWIDPRASNRRIS